MSSKTRSSWKTSSVSRWKSSSTSKTSSSSDEQTSDIINIRISWISVWPKLVLVDYRPKILVIFGQILSVTLTPFRIRTRTESVIFGRTSYFPPNLSLRLKSVSYTTSKWVLTEEFWQLYYVCVLMIIWAVPMGGVLLSIHRLCTQVYPLLSTRECRVVRAHFRSILRAMVRAIDMWEMEDMDMGQWCVFGLTLLIPNVPYSLARSRSPLYTDSPFISCYWGSGMGRA